MFENLHKVIIIEDSEDDVEFYQRLLKKICECHITVFSSVQEALSSFENLEYDLILLDYHLPGLTGVNFLQKLKERNISLKGPIITLTGQGSENVAVEFMHLGVTDYILKTEINLETLSNAIYSALNKFNRQTLEKEKQEELAIFAHTVAHDLKGPLGRINSYARLLSRKVEESNKKYTDNIQGDALYMIDFIDRLLAYSAMGRSGFEIAELSLNEIVEKAIQNLEVNIKNKKAEIRYGHLGCVMGDKIGLIQLFQNLIGNSVKYCNQEPRIVITYETRENDILIKLTDNGIGIPPELAEVAFKPFSRLPNNLEENGTGLGLALCDKIVKQHKATISIESSSSGGTCFTMTFPRLSEKRGLPVSNAS